MTGDKETLLQAYLDGELSASEATAFEASLTDEERKRLPHEIEFESGLAEALSKGGDCPDDVWARTQALLAERAATKKPRFSRTFMYAATMAAAASLALVISVFVSEPTSTSTSIVMAAESVEDLEAMSMVKPGADTAEAFIHEHGLLIGLHFEEAVDASHHYGMAVVGARNDKVGKDSVGVVLYVCCARPIKVIIAKSGTKGADLILHAHGSDKDNDILEVREVGDYVAAVVGKHKAHDLLVALAPQ